MANVNPIFYDEGHEPVNHDPLCKILQKILGAIIDQDPNSAAAGNATAGNQVLEIAQLTAINGKLATLGQKTMAGSMPVVIASDQSPIPVTGTVTETNASIGTNGAAIPTSSTQVGGSDGTNLRPLSVDTTGKANINNISGTVSLPTGASTSALQTTGNTSLSSIDGKLPSIGAHVTAASVAVNIASDQVVPVSAAALPLPSGASTSALQTTGNTSLSSIDGKLGTLGQKAMAGSAPVVLASDQSAIPVTVASVPLPTGAATEATLAKIPVAQGSTTSGESGPLVQGAVTTAAPSYTTAQTSPLSLTTVGNLRVDGSSVTQPVSAASLPLPSGAATSALQTTGNTSLSSIDGKLVDGHGTAAAALRVELPTDGTGVIATVGAVTAITNALPTGANVIGQVTANAGTNLNTSALALESGGNLATVASAVLSQASATAAQKGILHLGAVTTAAPSYTTAQTNPLSLTTAGALRVDASGSTQPVSGTVAATQSGTWTVQVGNTPNTTPILANAKDPTVTTGNITAVDAATTTTANSIGQNNVTGTPTTNSSVTCSIDGEASIAIQLSGTASLTYTFERSIDGGTTFTPLSLEEIGVGASVTSLTTSDNKAYFLRANVAGINKVRVRCTAYTSGTAVVTIQPAYGSTQIPVNQGTPNSAANSWATNIAQMNGVTTTMGNGVSGTGVQRVTIASDSTGVVGLATGANVIGSLTANQSTNIAQMNGVTVTMGNGVSGTGVQRVSLASDSTGQVALAASEAHAGFVGITTVMTSQAFTRPSNTTAYAANQVVGFTAGATNMTFSSAARVNNGSGRIVKARLMANSVTTTNALFRLFLFNAAPTAQADQAAFNLLYANRASSQGFIDFAGPITSGGSSDSIEIPDTMNNGNLKFVCTGGVTTLYGILVALAAYVPTSAETFYTELTIEQD